MRTTPFPRTLFVDLTLLWPPESKSGLRQYRLCPASRVSTIPVHSSRIGPVSYVGSKKWFRSGGKGEFWTRNYHLETVLIFFPNTTCLALGRTVGVSLTRGEETSFRLIKSMLFLRVQKSGRTYSVVVSRPNTTTVWLRDRRDNELNTGIRSIKGEGRSEGVDLLLLLAQIVHYV